MPSLTVTEGPLRGKRFDFDTVVVLGRGELATLDLDDAAVSRRHARIQVTGGRCLLDDLGSGNGTFVNGNRIVEQVKLEDGDEVRLGKTHLKFLGAAPKAGSAPARPKPASSEHVDVSVSLALPIIASPATTSGGQGAADRRVLQERLNFTSAIAEIMSQTVDAHDLLSQVLRQVMATLPQADRACVSLIDESTGEIVPALARTRAGEAAEVPFSRKMLRSAIDRREAILVADTSVKQSGPEADSVIGRLGLRSILCVPLVAGGTAHGAVHVDTFDDKRPFQRGDLAALVGVAPAISLALANAALHRKQLAHELEERDLQLAFRIQSQLLPQNAPTIAGWSLAGSSTPALHVGGDLYDYLPHDNGRVGLAIGDVSGKGVSAALVMARLMSDLHFVASPGRPPEQVLQRLNRRLCEAGSEGMFATFLYLELDPTTGVIEVANAGHPPPLKRRTDGRVEELQLPRGLAAGVGPGTSFERRSLRLAPGEALLFYTDGATDAIDPRGERFGDERLQASWGRAQGTAEQRLTAVGAELRAFQSGTALADDLTLVTIVRLG